MDYIINIRDIDHEILFGPEVCMDFEEYMDLWK